jgi:hypothetical protein
MHPAQELAGARMLLGSAADDRFRSNSGCCQRERGLPAHRRHPTRNRAGYVFNLSETVPANAENGRDRERPEHQRAGGLFVVRGQPRVPFPPHAILRSLDTTNKSRERNSLDCR